MGFSSERKKEKQKMGCGQSGVQVIETELLDDDGVKVGNVQGLVYPDWYSLNTWLAEKRVTSRTVTALQRTTDIFPVAILDDLSVDMDQRGNGHGRIGIKYFLDCALEEDAKSSIVIVDQNVAQREGFNAKEWMEKNGYASLGSTQRGKIVMFRRYDG